MMLSGRYPAHLLALLAGCFFITGFPCQALASGFTQDATLKGGIDYWQRQRDRKDVSDGHYKTNLSHGTWNASLDFSSGYVADLIGLDLAAFTAIEMTESSASGHPNEIAFSSRNRTYDEDYSGDKGGVSLYKAAVKFRHGPLWAHAGYIQPQGQSLLAPHWSLLPGTYQGAEAGTSFDVSNSGTLSLSYMWANRYKAPWHTQTDRFYQADRQQHVSYVHSLGAKYAFNSQLLLEGAVGQSQGYVNQYFAKVSYPFSLAGAALASSYQFYGAQDRVSHQRDPNSIYDGLAWLQALTFGYKRGSWDLRLEGTWVKAEGNQGFFLQRMTPGYASSNGRLDIWWDNRSDFNANGEKALFAGILYDLSRWAPPGFAIGGSAVYGWGARPSTNPQFNQHQRLKESAWSLDAMYTFQQGFAKGTLVKLHFTRYNNHSDIASWSGGYGNIFQDEKDIKFIVMAPFSLF